MSVLTRVLPVPAGHRQRDPIVTWYEFVALALVMLARSAVPLFAGDTGRNSIATLIAFEKTPGAPDPNLAAYISGTTPGATAAVPMLLLASAMWLLSLRPPSPGTEPTATRG